jgi:hypothetical protein
MQVAPEEDLHMRERPKRGKRLLRDHAQLAHEEELRRALLPLTAAIGVKIGAISPAVNAAIILVAVVMCTVSPLLYTALHTDEIPQERKAIIVGAGRVGSLLGQLLMKQKFPAA